VQVKVLGWIKGAVEFIKMPARLRKGGSQPDAPHEIDPPAAAQDASPETVEVPAESQPGLEPDNLISSEPKIRPSIESESPISVALEHTAGAESESRINLEPESAQDEEEIDRRRGIVRAFFNDYWSSVDEKPASFSERLDGAEGYINERVAARGEAWRLDPATRKQLGLPRSRKP
jgi:hypothetical protein